MLLRYCASFPLLLSLTASALVAAAEAPPKLKALIVDGQNNHDWKKTTPVMKKALESCGRFTVDVATSPPARHDMSGFKPNFAAYDVVLSNYNGDPFSPPTRQALLDYVKNGGGFVVVHAANNAFGDWKEFNEMIGLGGWGGRNEKSGPYVYFKDGKQVVDTSKGHGGGHGPQHPFQIIVRDTEHPITKGMPTSWMHDKDELYTHLRGPARNMKILATALAPKTLGGRDFDEPMLIVLDYGRGRVFHTPMGHADYSMKCSGFITSLERGAEWAATGKVTLPIPDDFPKADAPTSRGL